MRYLALVPVGLCFVGCGTTVIGDGLNTHTGGEMAIGGASTQPGVGGETSVGGASTQPGVGGNAGETHTTVTPTGGSPFATGGTSSVTSGGASFAGGPSATGGTSVATGGMMATGGSSSPATGGSSGVGYCGGTIVDNKAKCALDDAFCTPLSDGRYCTGGWVAPCPDGTESMPTLDCPQNQYWCWQSGMTKACRLPLRTSTECVAAGGIVQTDPGDGSSRRDGCASPLINLGLVDSSADIEWEMCCGQGAGTATGLSYCGGTMVSTQAQCGLDDAYCYQLSNGQYCTGASTPRCPEGTNVVSTANCPESAYWCWRKGLSYACSLPTRSPDTCAQAGGQVQYDPGDGSLGRQGCPSPLINLGLVEPGGIEGAICCGKPASTSKTPAVECRTEAGVTGWYEGTTLICEAKCTGCTATCQYIGSNSEGWYTYCQSTNAYCAGAGRIEFASCAGN